MITSCCTCSEPNMSQHNATFPLQAGLIDEMLQDTFEGLEDDDLEELADKEVEKVLFEVTNGEDSLEKRRRVK